MAGLGAGEVVGGVKGMIWGWGGDSVRVEPKPAQRAIRGERGRSQARLSVPIRRSFPEPVACELLHMLRRFLVLLVISGPKCPRGLTGSGRLLYNC
jgi:hypothetical protein